MVIMNERMEAICAMAPMESSIYLLSAFGCRLYKVEVRSGEVEEVQEITAKEYAYRKMVVYQESLIFVPASAKDIYIYNTRIKSHICIPVPVSERPYDDSYKFSNAFVVGHKIFFIPHFYPNMLILDMRTGEITGGSKVLQEELAKVEVFSKLEFFSGSGVVVDKKINVTSYLGNKVLEIDAISCEMQFYEVGKTKNWYSCIAYDGEDIWLTGKSRTITKWNRKEKTIKEYDYPKDYECEENRVPFSMCYKRGNNIVFLPQCANMAVSVDVKREEVFQIEAERGIENAGRYITYAGQNQKAWFYDNFKHELVSCCDKDENIEKVTVSFPVRRFVQSLCVLDKTENMAVGEMDNHCMEGRVGRSIYETSKMVLENQPDRYSGRNYVL